MARYFGKGDMHDSGISYKSAGTTNQTFSVFDDDSDFWNDYNQLNDQYKKQLDPFLHYEYSPGLFDRLGNWLGINTAEDKYRLQMQQQARAQLIALQGNSFNNDYDSKAAQASRMRDAGLNPDLTGSAEGESASEIEQPLQTLDTSIFDPPTELLTDLGSLFGSAVTGCQSIGAFIKTLGELRKLKADTSGQQITNAKEAFDYAGEWLSSFDPKTRLDFGDVDVTEDFFNQKAPEAIVNAFVAEHPGMSKETNALVRKAMMARLSDPQMMYNYYTRYNSASQAKMDMVARQKVYGKPLEEAEDLIYDHNKLMIDYMSGVYRYKYEYDKLVLDYNMQKSRNDFNYESWKAAHNVPEAIGEADLAFFLRTKAEHDANEQRFKYQKTALNTIRMKMLKGDPFASYLYYSWLHPGSMPPYMTLSGKIGPFSGSWNVIPGFGMDPNPISTFGKGVGQGIAPGGVPNGPGHNYADIPFK